MSFVPGAIGRPRVAIESPYKGDIPRNETFARRLCRWAIAHGASPWAMHLLLPQPGILDEHTPSERALGIECGLVWTDVADEVWFCLRPGEALTTGMQLAVDRNAALDAWRGSVGLPPRRVRFLVFTQEGEYVSGWEGALPTPTIAPVLDAAA